jgi:transcriptional regulator with XRE-family HTH domain
MKKTQRDKYAERFADYVIEAMERTGLKQIRVAELTGISRQTISQIVGRKPSSTTGKLLLPERETVDKIARAFGDPLPKARLAAGYAPLDGQAETVEQALDATLYWEQKKLNDNDKNNLRFMMESLDREAGRLAMHKQPPRTPTSTIRSQPRKKDNIDEAIDAALAYGGKPISDKDRQRIREIFEKRDKEKESEESS